MAAAYDVVAAKLAEIEAEMWRLGWWEVPEPTAPEWDFKLPFALDTMAFQQWLRFVLVPNARMVIAAEADFPAESNVAVQAARELDREAERLVALLAEFDQLFNKPRIAS